MSAAQDGQVRIGEPVSFGEAGRTQARVVHGWFGNPFTYPASLVFALRNGLPIGSYDLLAATAFSAIASRPYGRVDIGSGDELCSATAGTEPERDGSITFRWVASPATLLVPLDHAASLAVQVRAQAFNYPGASPQSLSVYVNGTLVAAGLTAPPEWTTIEFVTEERAWRAGVNRVRSAVRACDATRRRRLRRRIRDHSRQLIDYVRVQKR